MSRGKLNVQILVNNPTIFAMELIGVLLYPTKY